MNRLPQLDTIVSEMKIHGHLDRILVDYRDRLREVLGGELDSVLLYGSQARGDSTDDSDIDILCVLKRPFNYGEMVLAAGEVSSEIGLEHDVVISTAFVSREDYEGRGTPFLINVRREARPV